MIKKFIYSPKKKKFIYYVVDVKPIIFINS